MPRHLYTLLALLLLPLPARADVTLIRDGKPAAVIIVDASPSTPAAKPNRKKSPETEEAKAAQTLVDWVRKITDATLPVATAPHPGLTPIYLGKAAVAAGLKLDDIASPSHEGVRIVVTDDRILIAGQSDAATHKAACRFLETLGCRYFMDGSLGEVFPRTQTLVAKTATLTEKPGLAGRNPKGPSWPDAGFRAWNGAGGDPIHHQHSWGSYVPPSLFAQHPDWFAMGADGVRKPSGWLCTSNPQLREYFANAVIAAIDRGAVNPSLSPTDGRGYCQCPACKAQDDPHSIEPSTGTVSVTDRYVDFFDDVARRVAAKHPESTLSFICYADYTQPPTRARKLSPNLCAVIAPIRYCRLHEIGHPGCPSREQQRELTDRWAAVASRLGYYNYNYNLADGTLPSFRFMACKTEFPYLASKGVSFMTIEVLSNWQVYGPQIYLSLRMAYDPAADADAIMEDYWLNFYGPAAGPIMKQYWMGIDAATEALPTHAGSFFGLQQAYTPTFIARCEDLLARAADAARGNPAYEQRVALHAQGFQSAVDYRHITDAMAAGHFADADQTLEAALDRLHALGRQRLANAEYATAYLERFLAKSVRAGAAATAAPNKVRSVLPDRWRFAIDADDQGAAKHFAAADFDDSAWPQVATYSATLDAQGQDSSDRVLWYRTHFTAAKEHGRLTLFFSEVDGEPEVYVNGTKMAVSADTVAPKRPARSVKVPATPATTPATRRLARQPFEVDVADAVHEGDNTLAVRIDHTRMTDLALGGILRPVALIEKPR